MARAIKKEKSPVRFRSLPLMDDDARAKQHYEEARYDVLSFNERFSEETESKLLFNLQKYCNIGYTSLAERLMECEYRSASYMMDGGVGEITNRRRKGEDGCTVLPYESWEAERIMVKCILAEMEFRFSLVEQCRDFVDGLVKDEVRNEVIGRRIVINKGRWPFPKVDPVRMVRRRPKVPKEEQKQAHIKSMEELFARKDGYRLLRDAVSERCY